MAQDKTTATGGGEIGAALATTEDHLRSFASNCRVQGARVRLDLTEMPYIGSGSYDAETTRRIGEAVGASLPPSSDGVGVAAEPVAWAYEYGSGDSGWRQHVWPSKPVPSSEIRNIRPLYEHPPVAAAPTPPAGGGETAQPALSGTLPNHDPVALCGFASIAEREGDADTARVLRDAAAEIRRLRKAATTPVVSAPGAEGGSDLAGLSAAVEAAYREGWRVNGSEDDEESTAYETADWEGSEAKVRLTPTASSLASSVDEIAAAPSAPTAGAAVAGVAGDLDGLSARRKTHLLPDRAAQRYSWDWVQYMVAKSRAAALSEATEIAKTQLVIAGITKQARLASIEGVYEDLKKLSHQAAKDREAARTIPAASRTEVGREEIGAPGSDPGVQGEAVAWAVPDGWDLVPKEPTEEMWLAGQQADAYPGDSYVAVWDAMLAAAPAAPRSADLPGRETVNDVICNWANKLPKHGTRYQATLMDLGALRDALLSTMPSALGAETRADGGGA